MGMETQLLERLPAWWELQEQPLAENAGGAGPRISSGCPGVLVGSASLSERTQEGFPEDVTGVSLVRSKEGILGREEGKTQRGCS